MPSLQIQRARNDNVLTPLVVITRELIAPRRSPTQQGRRRRRRVTRPLQESLPQAGRPSLGLQAQLLCPVHQCSPQWRPRSGRKDAGMESCCASIKKRKRERT